MLLLLTAPCCSVKWVRAFWGNLLLSSSQLLSIPNEALCSSETSVTIYFTTERNNPVHNGTAIPSAYHAVLTGTACRHHEGSQAVHTTWSRQGRASS